MASITRKGAAGSVPAVLTSIIGPAGPATALTLERTYLPPFEEVATVTVKEIR